MADAIERTIESLDGPPPFTPAPQAKNRAAPKAKSYPPAMPLRDWLAGQAMLGVSGYLTGLSEDEVRAEIIPMARNAYLIADAMLAARQGLCTSNGGPQ